MTDISAHNTHSPSHGKVFLWSGVVWLVPAILSSTQQWAQLLDTPKHMSWFAAFLYQAPSWLVLWILSPLVLIGARRWPIEGIAARRHLVLHVLLAVLFGILFVLISIPVRRALHPKPVAWSFFGLPYFKSVPQFAVVGSLAYAALVVIGMLHDARARLRVLGAESQGSPEPVTGESPPVSEAPRIVLETRVGQSIIDPDSLLWIEPDGSGGCVLKTIPGDVRTRTTMAELEQMLEEFGFCRVHRSRIVNISKVAAIAGGAHRDGEATLVTGHIVPVSRRKREALAAMIAPKMPI